MERDNCNLATTYIYPNYITIISSLLSPVTIQQVPFIQSDWKIFPTSASETSTWIQMLNYSRVFRERTAVSPQRGEGSTENKIILPIRSWLGSKLSCRNRWNLDLRSARTTVPLVQTDKPWLGASMWRRHIHREESSSERHRSIHTISVLVYNQLWSTLHTWRHIPERGLLWDTREMVSILKPQTSPNKATDLEEVPTEEDAGKYIKVTPWKISD